MKRLSLVTKLLLKKAKAKALLITDLTNIRYLTGLQASAGILLISRWGMQLFIDGRYTEIATETLQRSIHLKAPSEFLESLKGFSSIAFEGDNVTVTRLGAWKKKYRLKKFVPTSGLVEDLRRVKSRNERTSIKRACQIALKLLATVPGLLKTGVSETKLALMLQAFALDYGADEMSFETIVAFGENSSRPHHHPTSRVLKRGDVVQIDLGVRCDGYCSDYSRVFVHGKKTSEHRRVEKALKEAKKAAELLVKKGRDVRALDRTARKVLSSYGLEKFFVHSLGHGLGLDIHEKPTISKKSSPCILRKNEVITIEPGVYFPGKWGMRIEDTIFVS